MNFKRFYLRPEFWAIVLTTTAGGFHYLHQAYISVSHLAQTYWPVIFIFVGVFQVVTPRYRDMASTIFLILIGITLLLFNTQVITIEQLREHSPEPLREIINSLIKSILTMTKSIHIFTGALK